MRRATSSHAGSPTDPDATDVDAPRDGSAQFHETIDALERVREQLADTQRTLDEFVARIRDTEPADRPGVAPGDAAPDPPATGTGPDRAASAPPADPRARPTGDSAR